MAVVTRRFVFMVISPFFRGGASDSLQKKAEIAWGNFCFFLQCEIFPTLALPKSGCGSNIIPLSLATPRYLFNLAIVYHTCLAMSSLAKNNKGFVFGVKRCRFLCDNYTILMFCILGNFFLLYCQRDEGGDSVQGTGSNLGHYVMELLARPVMELDEQDASQGGEDSEMNIARALVKKASAGDLQAIKEIRSLTENLGIQEKQEFQMPAKMLAEPYLSVWRDIKNRMHTEYVLYGGRADFAAMAVYTHYRQGRNQRGVYGHSPDFAGDLLSAAHADHFPHLFDRCDGALVLPA